MRRHVSLVVTGLVALVAGAESEAQLSSPVLELSSGARYDPRVPTLEAVVGHDHGEDITSPDQVGVYLRALVEAEPERSRLVQYAESWEGRPLYLLIIASADRMTRLDAVQADLRQLADPRSIPDGALDALVARTPVVTWLLHGVHGNEISSTDAALAEAYHLLAARGDDTVDTILGESIVLIDPMENPDGRARFLYQHLLGRAAVPDAEPRSAEHDEPWPGGRSNHYLFDMNRDWFAQTQPETRGRIGLFFAWRPHVVVDLHEMNGNSSYFFAPPTEPLNPYLSESQGRWLETFGRANAAMFDRQGFAYFVRESYDLFYPGYGDSWPSLHGAIGMTYEQASARGLVFRRDDDTMLTYRDGVVRHSTAALTTAATAARHREQMLQDFVAHRRGVTDGDVAAYLLPPGNDASRAERLASQLDAQGIEVDMAVSEVDIGDRSLPAGTYVVPLDQPAGRLAATLLSRNTPMDEAFVEEQDRRRRRRQSDQIYDITGWSLPMIYDIEVVEVDDPAEVTTRRFAPSWFLPQDQLVREGVRGGAPSRAPVAPDKGPLPTVRVAYLMPWGLATAATVVDALQDGLRVRFADRAFTMAGREYLPGTAIFRRSENDRTLAARLGALAGRHDAEVVGTDTGWVEDGISLGSNQVRPLRAPEVLLAWDTPTSSQSAGWTRYVLERRYGQPTTVVRVASLGDVDLTRYDVLVLPSGSYTRALRGEVLERVRNWVRAGGTLITLGEATRWASRESTELLETRTELRDGSPEREGEAEGEDDAGPSVRAASEDEPFDLERAIQPDSERPELMPGSVLSVELDDDHWLSAGTDGEIQAIVEGRRVFTPIKLDAGVNVGVYATQENLVASGLAWDEAQDLLAQKAFLIHQPMGQGHLIAFAEDPNFRAFAEQTQLLFMNAVLLGPAH